MMREKEVVAGAIVLVTGVKPNGFYLNPQRWLPDGRRIDPRIYGQAVDDPLVIGEYLWIVVPGTQWVRGVDYVSVRRPHVSGDAFAEVYLTDMIHYCSLLTKDLEVERTLAMKERYPTAWARLMKDEG